MGTWEFQPETGDIFLDDICRKLFGFLPGETCANAVLGERVHPEDLNLMDQTMKRSMAGTDGGAWGMEFRVVWPDDSIHWLASHGRTYFSGEGISRRAVRLISVNMDITKRKRAEMAEREREKQFHTLANSIPQLCWMANADGWIYWYNERWYEYTGTNPEQMRGWGWQSVVHPDALLKVMAQRKNFIETRSPFEMTFQLRGADGIFRSFLTLVTPVLDDDGNVGCWFGTHTDITEITQAEEHIRQLNRIYAVLSEINQAIVREKDPTAMLEAACLIAVYKGNFRMAWIGMIDPTTQVLHPVASSGVVDGYLDRLSIDLLDPNTAAGPAGQCFHSGIRATCNDIERDPLYVNWRDEALRRGYRSSGGFPLKVDGQVVGLFNLYASEPGVFVGDELVLLDEIAMDISLALEMNRREEEHEQATEALRESEAKLQGIISSAMDAVISVDEEQRIVVFNQAAEMIFKCKASVAYGSTLDRFIPADFRAAHGEHIRCFGKDGATSRSMHAPAVLRALRFNGEEFPIEATISHIQAAGESLYTVILRDITERKRVEDRLSWSRELLRALAMRLQTAAENERLRISRELHDQLGSVLTGMKMDLDWIVRKHGKTGDTWVAKVQDSMKVIDSSIALVRKIATELRPDLLDAIGLPEAIEWHAEQFQDRTGIKCSVHFSEMPLSISSDRRIGVFRIFQEALTNVARHAHAKNVLVTLVREEADTVLTISDDGIGFSTDLLEHAGSLGVLGMQERALLLGADLRVESAQGSGTTVTLRMPFKDESTTEQDAHEDIDR